MNHPATSDDRTSTATLPEAPTPARARVGVLLVGPKEVRRKVRAQFGSLPMTECNHWHDLPAGPAVCIDARRFVYLSPDGMAALAGVLLAGADLVVPSSNAGIWPMCGLDAPSGSASLTELARHAEAIRHRPSEERLDETFPLPAVFGVADASTLTARPTYVRDVAASAHLLASVWCHQRETPLVSATMIVKNEAARIERAVAAALLIADEVVVYDTGSTDDTVELARAMGAAVRLGHWDDDFGRARNEARAMMRGDWFVAIDADDTIDATPEQLAALHRFLRSEDGMRAVSLHAVNVMNEVTQLTVGGLWVRRIFHRRMKWRHRIHEVCTLPDGSLPAEVRFEGVDLVHWGYGGGQADRGERNLRIAAKRYEESIDGEEGHTLNMFEYARTLLLVQRFEESEALLRQVAARKQDISEATLATIYLAMLANGRGNADEVETLLRSVIEGSVDPLARDCARWTMASFSTRIDLTFEMFDSFEGDGSVHYFLVVAPADEVHSLHAFLAAHHQQSDRMHDAFARIGRPAQQARAWWAAALALSEGDQRMALHVLDDMTSDDITFAICSLAGGPPEGAYDIVAAIMDRFGLEPAVETFLAGPSARCGFFAALDARLRLIEAGRLEAGDPIEQLANGSVGDCADRVMASLVLDALVPVEPARVSDAGRFVDDELIGAVLELVAKVLPEQLTEAASALAYSTERGLLVAEALEQIEAMAG